MWNKTETVCYDLQPLLSLKKQEADVDLMLDIRSAECTPALDLQRYQYSMAANDAACRNEHTDGNRHRISDAAILKLCDRTVQVHSEIPECQQEESSRGSTESSSRHLHRQSAPDAEAADEDFADDLELVAVISAAIAAYETYFRRRFCCPFNQKSKSE